jgi:Ala-tRNA(Pro) deacylase
MKCKERMEQYLRENDVPFESITHPQAFTMQEVAAALHVPGNQVAKVVMVKADEAIAMLVVPAPHRLNLDKVRAALGAQGVRLAKEKDFAGLFPDCATGAMPPFGNLYDIPVYADGSLAEQEHMVFRVGTHRDSMKIAYADFYRLAQPIVDEFSWQP